MFVNTRLFDGCLDLRAGIRVYESFINHENEIESIFRRFTNDTCIPCNASEHRTRYSFLLHVTRFMAHGVKKIIINFLPVIISVSRMSRKIFDVTLLHGRERERRIDGWFRLIHHFFLDRVYTW